MKQSMITRMWVMGSVTCALMAQGTVSGVLNDDKGNAFRNGARVMVVKVAERPEGFTPFVSHAVTDKDGRYQIGDVPAGKYELCVWTSGGDWVNLCRWGQAAGTALVTNGATAEVNVALTKGRVFTIDLKDDEGYLDRHENKSVGGFLDIGVLNEQRDLVEAETEMEDKVKRKYRVVVPVGVKFRVRAQSPLFDVKTENEGVQSLRVLQDLDQVIEERDAGKGVTLKVSGVKVVGVGQ